MHFFFFFYGNGSFCIRRPAAAKSRFIFESSDRLSRCVAAGGTCRQCGSPEMPLIPSHNSQNKKSLSLSIADVQFKTGLVFLAFISCVSVVSVCAFSVGCGLVWNDPLAG